MLNNLTKIAAAALIAAPLMAQAQADPEYTIRATANSNEDDEDYDGLVVFKNYVESASNGRIGVELFIGTQLCSTGLECIEGVSEGSIDVYISTSGGAAGIFPYVQVLDLPYVMSGDRVAEHVLTDTDFVRTMRDMALEDSDNTVRLMTIGNTGGWRNFANTVRRVQTPEDLAGLKIRTVVAGLPQELTRALGASPTPIPWPELFTSLQTGVVEGSKNGITDIMGMKFPDAGLQYMTLDGHAYDGRAVVDEQRSLHVDGRRPAPCRGRWLCRAAASHLASPKRKSIEAYEAFVEGGGDLYVPTPDEKAAFAEAASPVQDWFRENVDGGNEILDALIAGVDEAETSLQAEYDADLN